MDGYNYAIKTIADINIENERKIKFRFADQNDN